MNLKRSVIDRNIDLAMEVFARHGIYLPPFAFWTVDDWQHYDHEVDEIRDCMLGWDVTDFGHGDFQRIGRVLFTLRNGSARKPGYPKPYAEKLILNAEGQRAPAHFHRSKMEDIGNRAGGNILVQLTAADAQDFPSKELLLVHVDGRTIELEAGGIIRLEPGQSLCIPPRTIHQFWGEEGTGVAIGFEVSSVCDDLQDNCFLGPARRFPEIDEDKPSRYYLCSEYPEVS